MFKLISSLAVSNLKKNRTLYIPFSVASITMMVITYILMALSTNKTILQSNGGNTVVMALGFGVVIMLLVSTLTMIYANGFVMKNRSKEFGLYSILGLGRSQIQLLQVIEMVLFAIINLIVGLVLGVLLNRLAFVLLLKAMRFTVPISYEFQFASVIMIGILFSGIFVFLMILNAIKIRVSRPLELLREKKSGEKTGRFLSIRALIGVAILGYAYYISQSIESPIKALGWFFIAVLLVVIATYILFDAGSIALLRFLKNRKTFYYRPINFISVSNLIFRMRKNAMGLASICILSTMVLVTLGTTGSLQFGAQEVINRTSPTDFTFRNMYRNPEETAAYSKEAKQLAAGTASKVTDFYEYSYILTGGNQEGNVLDTNVKKLGTLPESMVVLVSVEDYNRNSGENITVKPGEMVIGEQYTERTKPSFTQIAVGENTFSIGQVIDVNKFAAGLIVNPNITDHSYIGLLNEEDMAKVVPYYSKENDEGYRAYTRHYIALWNTSSQTDDEKKKELEAYQQSDIAGGIDGKIEIAQLLFQFYGSLLFLGILLAIAFSVGAVLVIYYKQVSEGYEDRERYVILKKIGIDQPMIHQSINRQVLIVFFLPLLTAFLHTALSYNIVSKIVLIFGIKGSIIGLTMLAVAGVFMIAYFLVYKITSREYFKIINR
ncbi:FtsX-like permease family protein [uncultured Granulicatella sp.]|uniref:FtsX-like permease family protein n=1 Tax=uncultured Granulicatella sp. TaxID=316089 RepID=UPI0028F11DFE|nr:FtsX-like permease family protein [uncultured Granulicatella sp.]